jgi:hypothetical protein
MCYDKLWDEITPTPSWAYAWGTSSGSSVSGRIAAFLDGRTCGEDLLHELYDHVLDEPIPDAMRTILNKI